jgi:hypothetical protein
MNKSSGRADVLNYGSEFFVTAIVVHAVQLLHTVCILLIRFSAQHIWYMDALTNTQLRVPTYADAHAICKSQT